LAAAPASNMSALATITPTQVFGLAGSVRNNVCYISEDEIVYPAGSTLVRYNLTTKKQEIKMHGTHGSQGFAALAVSPNRRYAAAAERGSASNATSVHIYDLQTGKKKMTKSPPNDGAAVISLAFSPDSKYIVTLTGEPDWELHYWMWEKTRPPMASAKVSAEEAIYEVAFNPEDNTHLCAVGNGSFKLFRYQEGTLRQLAVPKMEPQDCLCHAWLPEGRIIVGTSANKVLLIDGVELKAEFDVYLGDIKPENQGVVCIAALTDGFVCGGAQGILHRFEFVEEEEPTIFFKRKVNSRTPNDVNGIQNIKNVALSPNESMLVATTDVDQIYSWQLKKAPDAEQQKSDELPVLQLLSQPFHHDAVKGLSLATRKPLVATSSRDCSIRVWNYMDNSVELHKYFPEEPLSLDLHPSGLFVLVGFTDKLRLLNLLIDDIRLFREFPIRNCRECAFANGGHKFAAMNGQHIEIYSTYTFENIGHLKGHNQKVTSIVWSQDDSKLVSCGMDGAVYEWDAQTYERVGENVLKSCSYTCVTTTPDAGTLFAVGSDKTLKEIKDNTITMEIASHNKLQPHETVLSQIALSHSGRVMAVGTETGAIRSVTYPLTSPWEGTSTAVHFGCVNKMAVSHDDKYLFTVGDDGCLFISTINDKESRRPKEQVWADEILITKCDLEDKNRTLEEKNTQVEELKITNEYQMRLKEMKYKDQMKAQQVKFEQEIEALKLQLQMLQTEKDREESRFKTEASDDKDTNARELQDIENAHNQKLLDQYEKFEKLQRKSQEMQERCERQLDELEKEKTRALEDLAEFWENKLLEKSGQLDAANEQKRQAEREHLEVRRQIEIDADREILSVKNSYERTLKEERETSLRLKGDNGILQKKFKGMVNEIKEHKQQQEDMQTEQQKLGNHILALEKEILSGKKDCEERDETIQDKEKRIYDLKKKNQELEKFKFVLDYKIRELKKQIEPRENDIKQMNLQIGKMDEELANYHKSNTDLKLQIEKMNLQLNASDSERRKAEEKAALLDNRLTRFQADLHISAALVTEPIKLADSVKKLYQTYCEKGGMFKTTIEEDIQKEHNRQREFLERSVAGLRGKLDRTSKKAGEDTSLVMNENVVLIREINELRRELAIADQTSKQLEANLHHIKRLNTMQGRTVPEFNNTQMSADAHDDTRNLERIIDMQKMEIRNLRTTISDIDRTSRDRPPSTGTRLDPIAAGL